MSRQQVCANDATAMDEGLQIPPRRFRLRQHWHPCPTNTPTSESRCPRISAGQLILRQCQWNGQVTRELRLPDLREEDVRFPDGFDCQAFVRFWTLHGGALVSLWPRSRAHPCGGPASTNLNHREIAAAPDQNLRGHRKYLA